MSIRESKRRKVFNKLSGRCAYCGDPLDFENFHIDHIIPKVKKGNNDINNLLPSCCLCNLTKGDLNIEEYRDKISNLSMNCTPVILYLKYYRVKIIPLKFYFEKICYSL